MLSGRVALAGSRCLGPWAAGLVSSVVRAAAAAGADVGVGCCRGADHLALSAAVPFVFSLSGDGPRVRVFAAFGPAGAGALPSSSPSLVLAADRYGVPVSWWAGGGLSVPPRARLARRSRALVSWAGAGPGPGTFACFVADRSAGSGSLRAAAFAASLSLFVLAFPLGDWSGPPDPLLNEAGPGRWSRCSGLGPGVPFAWLWLPAQLPLEEVQL